MTYTPVHAYGGREHDQPAPVEGCLLCRLEAAERHGDEMRQLAHRLEEESVDHTQIAKAALDLPLWRMEEDGVSDEEIAAVLRFRKALEAVGRQPSPRRTIPGACNNCGAPSAENVSWNPTGGWKCGACGESDYPEAAE